MGIDFDPSEAHWSYSGFNHFRRKLAEEAGIALDFMNGFGGCLPWRIVNDSIKPLLNHSDCDGELTVEECGQVYPRLLELMKNWDDNDYDKIHGKLLADAMKNCHEKNIKLRFC